MTTEQPFQPSAASFESRGTSLAGAELAGFWRRFAAYLIDAILLGVVGGVVGGIIGAIVHTQAGIGVGGGIVTLVLGLAYFSYFWSTSGQSVGYMALGIKLVRSDGAPVTFGLAALRYLMIYLSFLVCALPALASAFMVGMRKQKQAIHDLVVGTLVVRA